MKTILIAAVMASFMLESAFAREVVLSPDPSHKRAISAVHPVMRFASVGPGGEPCTTEYVPTHDRTGWYLRKDVDCVE